MLNKQETQDPHLKLLSGCGHTGSKAMNIEAISNFKVNESFISAGSFLLPEETSGLPDC